MNAKDFPRLSIPKPPKERGKFPARLHVLLAQDAKVGLVIRRGPSKLVCTVLWNRERNTFKLGQWMRGRIYERRSDLSPDGKHFIYFAMNGKWESETKGAWTAISRVPYLNALALYAKGDCCAILKIPKGFQPSAQGCEERATLGGREKQITTLQELRRPASGRGCVGKTSRSAWRA